MRLRLPDPQSPDPPSPGPGGSTEAGNAAAGAAPVAGAPARRASLPVPTRIERLTQVLTAWAVVLPLVLLCSSVLTWSIGVRLLNKQHVMRVNARSLKPIEVTEPPVTDLQLEDLRREAARVAAALPGDAQELGPILSEWERQARDLGWRVELTRSAPRLKPAGFSTLILHACSVQLSDEAQRPEPAYQRLLAWLRLVSAGTAPAEVTALRLRSVGAGLGGAQVDLSFLTRDPHAQNPAK